MMSKDLSSPGPRRMEFPLAEMVMTWRETGFALIRFWGRRELGGLCVGCIKFEVPTRQPRESLAKWYRLEIKCQ